MSTNPTPFSENINKEENEDIKITTTLPISSPNNINNISNNNIKTKKLKLSSKSIIKYDRQIRLFGLKNQITIFNSIFIIEVFGKLDFVDNENKMDNADNADNAGNADNADNADNVNNANNANSLNYVNKPDNADNANNENNANYLVSEIIKNLKCLGVKEVQTNYNEVLYKNVFDYKEFLFNIKNENIFKNKIENENIICIKIKYKQFLNENFDLLINYDNLNIQNNNNNNIIELQYIEKEAQFFLCKSCLKYSSFICEGNSCKETININKETINVNNIMRINDGCLLGAFFVQEIIKMLCGNEDYLNEFQLSEI
ncbi:hypothetical protein CDIK_0707 [Cucumispora dikerogammari]|nr:hypothetical protein CDIK_0707 [Cucumispora dikerogammari]